MKDVDLLQTCAIALFLVDSTAKFHNFAKAQRVFSCPSLPLEISNVLLRGSFSRYRRAVYRKHLNEAPH